MAEYPILVEADKVTPAAPLVVSLEAGASFGPNFYWLFEDLGGTHGDAETLSGSYLKVEGFDGAKWVTNGLPALDERWTKIAVLDIDNAGDASMVPQITGTTAIGAGKVLQILDVPKHCGRKLSIGISAPGSADTVTQQLRIVLVTKSTSIVLAGYLTIATGQGVLPTFRNPTLRRFVSGRSVITAADDHPIIERGILDYDGMRYVFLQDSIVLNQNAFDGALAAGQAYLAVASQNINGTITVTKSNKNVAPVLPAWPNDEVYIAQFTVDYQVGGTSIIDNVSVNTAKFLLGEFLVVAGTGLSVKIYPGEGLSTDAKQLTNGVSFLAVDDDASNWIWLTPANGFAKTTTAFSPEVGSYPLAKVVTAAGVITSIADLRYFVELPTAEYTLVGSLSMVLSTAVVPVSFPMMILGEAMELSSVSLDIDKVDGTWTAGSVQFDIVYLGPGEDSTGAGTTLYTGFGTDDQRPTILFDATIFRWSGEFHQVRRFERGTRFVAKLIAVPSAPGPEPARFVVVQLHFRRIQ